MDEVIEGFFLSRYGIHAFFLLWIADGRADRSEISTTHLSLMDIVTCFYQTNYASWILKRTGSRTDLAGFLPPSEDNLVRRHLLEPLSSYGVLPRGPPQPSWQLPVASSLELHDA